MRVHRLAFTLAIACSSAAQAAEINVAQIAAFTGLPSTDATELYDGARAYFSEINEAGGIVGRSIAFDKFDDRFIGDETVATLKRITEEKKYVAILSPTGSVALAKAIEANILDKAGVIVLNVIPGSELFRKPGHPFVFHVRASDRAQLERIVRHSKLLNFKKIVVVHQDIPFGVNGARIINEAATQTGEMSARSFEVKPDQSAMVAVAKAITSDGSAQSVVVVGTPKFSADVIAKLRATGSTHPIYTLSYVPAGLITKIAGEASARGVGIAQTFPPPNGRVLKVQREFQATMKKFAPDIKALTHFHLEGYLCARVLVKALQQSGGRAGPQALAQALRSASPLDIGGFTIDYRSSNEGSRWTDLAVISRDGSLRY